MLRGRPGLLGWQDFHRRGTSFDPAAASTAALWGCPHVSTAGAVSLPLLWQRSDALCAKKGFKRGLGSVCDPAAGLLAALLDSFCFEWPERRCAGVRGLWHEARVRTAAAPRWAVLAFAGYCAWNLYWLAQARVPPSLFLTVTGYPCPTTGGLRSLQALLRGDWRASLGWNPLLPIYLGLLASSVWVLGGQALRRELLRLPAFVTWLWLSALMAGWVVQMCIRGFAR